MSKTKRKFLYPLTLFFVLAAVVLSAVFPSFGVKASADDTGDLTVVEAYEQRNVLDDLKGSTIGGVPFDLDDWPYNDRGAMQIVSFVEYAYSFYSEKQDDFGLYIYVYNPQGLAINTSSEHNKIQFTYGSNSAPIKPQLEFLNYSTEAGYEGLFYKFKITLSASLKTAILNNVQQNARVYTVTGFEVSVGGSVTEYTVGSTYTYSGYSEGYGSELATGDTLSCNTDDFDKYIELEVTHTVYRPQGNFYDGQQSQLNSCFFRVPEEYFQSYGDLYKVACEWYEYVTKPVLVTENWFIYNKLNALNGASISQVDSNYDFLFLAVGNTDSNWYSEHKANLGWSSDITMQPSYDWWEGGIVLHNTIELPSDTFFDRFSAVFYTGGKDYTEYGVSAEQLEQKFLSNSEALGGPLICDNYSAALFEDFVEEEHTRGFNGDVEVTADESKDIWWNITTKSFWQKMFGGYTIDTEYDSINAIETVEEADLQGTDEEIAARLYIAVADVNKLKTDFAKAKVLGERVILLRYGNSTYFSAPTAQAYVRSSSVEEPDWTLVKDVHKQMYKFLDYGGVGYSAYIAQTTVYLNFDIISLTFRANNVETVIPVVMSPSNAFSGITSPLEESYGTGSGCAKLTGTILLIILIVLAVLIIGPVLWPIISPVLGMILKGVVWVITAPFKLIGKLFKKKPKKETAQSPPQAPAPTVIVLPQQEYQNKASPPNVGSESKAGK